MPRSGCLLSTFLVAWLVLSATVPSSAEDAAVRSPDDAIAAYIEGIARQDLEAVLRSTSVGRMSAGFDFVAYVDRLRILPPQAPAPASSPFMVSINRANFTAQIARQVQFLAYGLMTSEDVIKGRAVQMDAVGATKFAGAVDPARLSGLSLMKVGLPNPSIVNSNPYRANAASLAGTYGADEASERVALILFEGDHYLLGFTLLRYGNDWSIYTQSSPLAGSDAMGVPVPITPEGFATYLE